MKVLLATMFFATACAASSHSVGSSAATVRSVDLISGALNANGIGLAPKSLAAFAQIAPLPILAWYDELLAQSTDGSFRVDDLEFSGVREVLVAQAPLWQRVAKRYANVGALVAASGAQPAGVTASEMRSSYQIVSRYAGDFASRSQLANRVSAGQTLGLTEEPGPPQQANTNLLKCADGLMGTNPARQLFVATLGLGALLGGCSVYYLGNMIYDEVNTLTYRAGLQDNGMPYPSF